jgi:hypothetical protein
MLRRRRPRRPAHLDSHPYRFLIGRGFSSSMDAVLARRRAAPVGLLLSSERTLVKNIVCSELLEN